MKNKDVLPDTATRIPAPHPYARLFLGSEFKTQV